MPRLFTQAFFCAESSSTANLPCRPASTFFVSLVSGNFSPSSPVGSLAIVGMRSRLVKPFVAIQVMSRKGADRQRKHQKRAEVMIFRSSAQGAFLVH